MSHSGRTDSSGGHYDRSTGEYHYHHGYGPHDHPNGICPYDSDSGSNSTKKARSWVEYKRQQRGISAVRTTEENEVTMEENEELLSELAEMWADYTNADIPISDLEETWRNDYTKQELIEDHVKTVTLLRAASYEIDELDRDLESTSRKLESADEKIELQRTTIANAYSENESLQEQNSNLQTVLIFSLLLSVVLFFVLIFMRKKWKSAYETLDKENRETKESLDKVTAKYVCCENEYNELKEEHDKLKIKIDQLEAKHRETLSIINSEKKSKYEAIIDHVESVQRNLIPDNTEIGQDGLPKEINTRLDWGAKYTVYFTDHGKKYHKASCSHFASTPMHVVYVRKKKHTACNVCKPELPNMEWYGKYKAIERFKAHVSAIMKKLEPLEDQSHDMQEV